MTTRQKALMWILATGLFFLGLWAVILLLPFLFRSDYSARPVTSVVTKEFFAAEEGEAVHLATPEPLKAIYMTSCVAATQGWRAGLKSIIDSTELNAVVIDIKDATGIISFRDESLQPNISLFGGCKVPDLKEFIEELHGSGIYVIGRISVFQDPYYTSTHPQLAVRKLSDGEVWKDHKGLSFIDVGAREYWDYIVRIAKASYELGFDELNFDYVRYPSDGNMSDVHYVWTSASSTRPESLESFFSYLYSNLQDLGAKLSVDLFGLTTTVENDMGIGQVLERALPYFDYIAPMVYPSHYPSGWNGWQNPAEHPYEVIHFAMSSAVEREALWRESRGLSTTTPSKMRPWLQDFHLGATYDESKIRAQIQATYDSGLSSWMLWNAGNKYTSSALLPE